MAPAMVARKMRSAHGAGGLNQALSAGWLLAGLAFAGLGVSYLARVGRFGWNGGISFCATKLSVVCYSIAQPTDDISSAVIVTVVAAVLLVSRWFAVSYGGLAPTRRGFVMTVGLVLGLAAFGAGMAGWIPPLPHSVFGGLYSLFAVPGQESSAAVSATVLIEFLVAAVSLTDRRRSSRLSRATR